jgi:hypothetical protein
MPYKLTGPKGGVLVKKATLERVHKLLPGLVKRYGKVSVQSNPPLVNPPHHTDPPVRTQMVGWAHWGLAHQKIFSYTETAARSQMFHRKPGSTRGTIYADCSQFYASVGHWCGLKQFTDTDYTGTLLQKGTVVGVPKPGDCVIFGPGTGTHAAMITEHAGNDWWTVGFGHSPGAPDRVLLSSMEAYFRKAGHPGVRFLSFTP